MQRPKTAQQAVTDAIREMILRGYLVPGERIDQGKIATQLEVSRMPVREALRFLEAEGLVMIYPHQGAVVSELSPEDIEELFFIRATLEGMTGRLAVTKLSDEVLREICCSKERMTVAQTQDEWLQLNQEFHMTIYRAAGRSRLLNLITSVRNTVRPYIRLYTSLDEHIVRADEQHEAILQACMRRDATDIEEAIQRHLQGVGEEVLSQIDPPSN